MPPRLKELSHESAAVFGKHAFGHLNLMVELLVIEYRCRGADSTRPWFAGTKDQMADPGMD